MLVQVLMFFRRREIMTRVICLLCAVLFSIRGALAQVPTARIATTIEELRDAVLDDTVEVVEVQQHLRGKESIRLGGDQRKYIVVRVCR